MRLSRYDRICWNVLVKPKEVGDDQPVSLTWNLKRFASRVPTVQRYRRAADSVHPVPWSRSALYGGLNWQKRLRA